MWTYNVTKGWLDFKGILVGKNLYSGHGEGLNNPKMEAVPNVGPIPCGEWVIVGPPQNTKEHGPYVLAIYPTNGTQTFGRSGFLMHGDEIEHVGENLASHGCIIASRETRERVYQSGNPQLTVVSGEETT